MILVPCYTSWKMGNDPLLEADRDLFRKAIFLVKGCWCEGVWLDVLQSGAYIPLARCEV